MCEEENKKISVLDCIFIENDSKDGKRKIQKIPFISDTTKNAFSTFPTCTHIKLKVSNKNLNLKKKNRNLKIIFDGGRKGENT